MRNIDTRDFRLSKLDSTPVERQTNGQRIFFILIIIMLFFFFFFFFTFYFLSKKKSKEKESVPNIA